MSCTRLPEKNASRNPISENTSSRFRGFPFSGSSWTAAASPANSGKALINVCATAARNNPTMGATIRSQVRRVCIAKPRNSPNMAVNIACPPSPNSAYGRRVAAHTSHAVLGIVLRHKERRLKPVEASRPAHHRRSRHACCRTRRAETEQHQDSQRLGDLLRDWRGNRRGQQHRCIRPQHLLDGRLQRDNGVDEQEEGSIERQSERGRNAPAPQESGGEEHGVSRSRRSRNQSTASGKKN